MNADVIRPQRQLSTTKRGPPTQLHSWQSLPLHFPRKLVGNFKGKECTKTLEMVCYFHIWNIVLLNCKVIFIQNLTYIYEKLIPISCTGRNLQMFLYHVNVCFRISFACKSFCETISISCRYGSNFLLLLPISWLEIYLFVAFRNKLVNTNCIHVRFKQLCMWHFELCLFALIFYYNILNDTFLSVRTIYIYIYEKLYFDSIYQPKCLQKCLPY